MAHNIALNMKYGGVRKPAWHGLGQTWDDQPTPVEALERIGGDFEIIKAPLTATLDDGTTVDTDRFALIRKAQSGFDKPAYLGAVTAEYEIIQNRNIAEYLEPLAAQWPVETVAVLGDGEQLVMTLKIGEWDVRGEAMEEYFLLHNLTDGKGAMTLAYTPIRVVCQNTLVSGLSKATVSTSFSHRRQAKLDAEFSLALLESAQAAQSGGREGFMNLTRVALAGQDIDQVLEMIYPTPVKPRRLQLVDAVGLGLASPDFTEFVTKQASVYAHTLEALEEKRATVKELFGKFNDEFPATANTGWALYNAAVEYADFSRGRGNIGESALLGLRATDKKRAFSILSELAV